MAFSTSVYLQERPDGDVSQMFYIRQTESALPRKIMIKDYLFTVGEKPFFMKKKDKS
jgi:hypothetical protein